MNPEQFLILKTFVKEFITGVSHRSNSLVLRLDGNSLKTYPGHVTLLTGNFFLNTILKGFFPL